MSKVLIDTEDFILPEKCSRCPFLNINQYDPRCKLTDYIVETELEFATKHEYCPLKEIEYNENN